MVSQRSQFMVNVRATRSTSWSSSTSSRWAEVMTRNCSGSGVAEDRGRHGVQHVDVEALDLPGQRVARAHQQGVGRDADDAGRRARGWRPRSAPPAAGRVRTSCDVVGVVAHRRGGEARPRPPALRSPAAAGAASGCARAAGEQGDGGERRAEAAGQRVVVIGTPPLASRCRARTGPPPAGRRSASASRRRTDRAARPRTGASCVCCGAGLEAARRGRRERRRTRRSGAPGSSLIARATALVPARRRRRARGSRRAPRPSRRAAARAPGRRCGAPAGSRASVGLGDELLLVRAPGAALDERERLLRLRVVGQRVRLGDGRPSSSYGPLRTSAGPLRRRARARRLPRSLAASARTVAQNSPALSRRCVRLASQTCTTTSTTSARMPSASSHGTEPTESNDASTRSLLACTSSSSCGQHVAAQDRGRLVEVRGADREALPVVGAGLLDQPGVRGQPRGRLAEQLGVGGVGPGQLREPVRGGRDGLVVPGALLGRLQAADEERVRRRRVRDHEVVADVLDADQLAWCRRRRRTAPATAPGRRSGRPRPPRAAASTATTPATRRRPGVRLSAPRSPVRCTGARRRRSAPRPAVPRTGRWSASRGLLDVVVLALARGSALDGPRRCSTGSSGSSAPGPGPPGGSAAAGPPSVAQRPAAARRAG